MVKLTVKFHPFILHFQKFLYFNRWKYLIMKCVKRMWNYTSQSFCEQSAICRWHSAIALKWRMYRGKCTSGSSRWLYLWTVNIFLFKEKNSKCQKKTCYHPGIMIYVLCSDSAAENVSGKIVWIQVPNQFLQPFIILFSWNPLVRLNLKNGNHFQDGHQTVRTFRDKFNKTGLCECLHA